MNKHITDLKILKLIYARYFATFKSFAHSKDRETKVFVSIDIEDLAKKLGINEFILFGRLYHHLGQKYKYKDEVNATVSLFEPFIGRERHCINFPYLYGVIADLEEKRRRENRTYMISALAIFIATTNMVFDILY